MPGEVLHVAERDAGVQCGGDLAYLPWILRSAWWDTVLAIEARGSWRLRHVGHVRYVGESRTRILRHGTSVRRLALPRRRGEKEVCWASSAGTASHRQRYGPGTTSTSCKHLSDICRRTSMTTTSTPGTVEASEVVMAHLARCSSAARAAELSAGDDPNVGTALIEKAQRLMSARSLS